MSVGRFLLFAQGGYYLFSGLWPLVSMRTFLQVTGPKTDLWLVKTVGVLVLMIGGTFILAGTRDILTREIIFLGMGSAAGLAAIDTIYVVRKVIAPIYLADAAAELLIVCIWAFVAFVPKA